MYLVTTVRKKTRIDTETGEPVADLKFEATVENNDFEVDRMLKLKGEGDNRLADTKIFRLQIAPNGRPTIGPERRK